MGSIGMDRGFLVSRDGIFKILQFIFSLLMLIMISATGYTYLKELGTFVYITFAGSFYCITLFMSFLIYFFKLYNLGLCGRIPWKILELGYSALCALLAVIAIGVAAQKANDLKLTNDPLVADIYRLSAAASVFAAVVFVLHIVYAILIFRGPDPRSVRNMHETGSA
ncbi:uncharacterized protein LOC143465336 [Clavelina lepadiformis]|uniref:uncharacterized protein LOC143465336 n=1 Tax=Clavelina lepadiformis TaxID=159417 RepID=UPI0040425533